MFLLTACILRHFNKYIKLSTPNLMHSGFISAFETQFIAAKPTKITFGFYSEDENEMFLTFYVGFLEYHHKCYENTSLSPLKWEFWGRSVCRQHSLRGSLARTPDSFGSYVLSVQPRRRVWNPTSRRNTRPPPLFFHHTPKSIRPSPLPPHANASVWFTLLETMEMYNIALETG